MIDSLKATCDFSTLPSLLSQSFLLLLRIRGDAAGFRLLQTSNTAENDTSQSTAAPSSARISLVFVLKQNTCGLWVVRLFFHLMCVLFVWVCVQ